MEGAEEKETAFCRVLACMQWLRAVVTLSIGLGYVQKFGLEYSATVQACITGTRYRYSVPVQVSKLLSMVGTRCYRQHHRYFN